MVAAQVMLASTLAASAVKFLSVGDWGGSALEGDSAYAKQTVQKVSAAMAAVDDVAFVVNTGDNFYWCGIQNTSDFQIGVDWLEPFQTSAALQVPWYSVLGNHEYGYNVDAQIELGKLHPNWVLPARYYTRRVRLGRGQHMTIVGIDTSPCVQQYRSTSSAGWDPCSSQYPTCSLNSNPDDQFEGKCLFHENIVAQDCAAQYQWLDKALAAVPANDWLLVVGHHPADEIDVKDFTSLLQKHGFDLYLNGHVHTLTQYTIDGTGAYVTSGAGSLVKTSDQEHQEVAVKAAGGNLTSAAGHKYKTVFNQKVAGFTQHTFSADLKELQTDIVSYEGKVLHSFTVSKGAGRV
eukprot:TRINITY_DN10829_c1_g1_i1.p1 TRINITY_DN10829_c1_g1~~TRINITY_DN10829_c1_g1_i1.p1  ORF type:complete len:373 (+),score=146.30 TRINITY_DN10829_c1_g1_i1:76-1119(+)